LNWKKKSGLTLYSCEVVDMGDLFEVIKAFLSTAMLAFFVVFLLPITLVILSVMTSSWVPIVLGGGVTVYAAVTIIKKHQRDQGMGDDNKVFDPELQEKALEYLLAVKNKKKDQTRA
jgi:hypothetical protein